MSTSNGVVSNTHPLVELSSGHDTATSRVSNSSPLENNLINHSNSNNNNPQSVVEFGDPTNSNSSTSNNSRRKTVLLSSPSSSPLLVPPLSPKSTSAATSTSNYSSGARRLLLVPNTKPRIAEVTLSNYQNYSFLPFHFTNSNSNNSSKSTLVNQNYCESHLIELLTNQLLQIYSLEEQPPQPHENTTTTITTIIDSQSLFESEQQQVTSLEKITTMESHQIDYNHPVVKTFLDNINNTLQCASTSGTDAKTYDTIWLQMGNKDLATVFLTVLMGKLLLTEQRAIQYRQKRREMEPSTINDGGDVSNSNNTNDDFNELNNNNNNTNNNNNNSGNGLGAIANSANNNSGLNLNASNNNDQDDFSVQEVVDLLQLGTHKFDPQHPLLIKRKESIKKRRARSLVIQTEETLSKEDVERAVSANQEAMLGSGGDDSSDGPNVVSYGDFSATRDDSIDERINFHFNTSLQNDRGLFSEKQFRERTAIMNSILYVSLFYRFDHLNPSLLDVMDKWRQTRTQQVQQNTQIVSDNVSDEMRDVLCPPIEALYKYLQLCADYDVVSDMDVTLRPQLSTSDPLATIGSYVYTRLQTICRIPRYTENVLGDLIILLRSCSTNQAYLSDHYDPIALKNSLNLTKLILSQLYIERESPKLAELSGVLKAYFLEPLPIGAMVHDVLRMCQQLQKDPGCLMRERFERSIRQCKDPKNGIDKIDRPRKVYVFYNPLSKKAHHLLDRIDIYPDGTAHFDIVATKANLVLNVFSQSGNNDLVAASHELYQKVLPETLAQQYAKATKNSLNPAELKFLKDELLKHPAQTTPPTYKRCESPKMPEAEFEYIALPEERNLAELEREAKIFPRCGFYSKLLNVLDRARNESGLPSDSDETLMVDVAIAGGSGTLQYFVHSLFLANRLKVLTEKRPQIDFKVFLIPLGENNYLSNWLEKYDGWFSRHVHQPIQSSLPLLPYLRTSNANRAIIARSNMKLARESTIKRSNTVIMTSGKRYAPLDAAIITQYKPPKKFLTPHRFMESMLSDFVTDASTSYPVHIYNAQFLCNEVVTITDPSGGNKTSQQKSRKVKEYISLSFCQRIDIGIVADAYQFAKDERIEGTPLEELLCHRNFRYQAPPLSVSYVPMDPTGEINRSSEINEQSKVYQNISIISCSSFGDRGSLVSPSQPWLEVFAENITTKKKSKLRDCDLGTNYHVGSISIESTTHQQFSVLLDGELYGPFHKMIINASTQTFNLQTFSNIDVY